MKNASNLVERARVLAAADSVADFRELVDPLSQSGEGDPAVLGELGGLASDLGLRGHALRLLSAALKGDPDNSGFASTLAMNQLHSRKPENALRALTPLNDRGTLKASHYLTLAHVYWNLGRFETALRATETAVEKGAVLTPAHEAMVSEIRRRATLQRHLKGQTVSANYADEIYRISDKYRVRPEESPYLPVWKFITAEVRKLEIRNVADYGCGPGQFAEHFFHDCPKTRYTGFDQSTEAIIAALQRVSGARFCRADFTKDEFCISPSFDCVLAIESLEHVEDDVGFVSRLPSGTKVIASVPNFYSFGHARWFLRREEVTDHYGPLLSDLTVRPFAIGRSTIFVLSGVRQ